jgi:hypothetical protein
MTKYYWLIAGVVVGVFSVLMAYVNFDMLVPGGVNGSLSFSGMIIVIIEYAVIVYLLSLGQKQFSKKK